MEEITVQVKDSKTDFKLYFLELKEWEKIPQFFPCDQEIFNSEWFNQIPSIKNIISHSQEGKTAKIRPGVIRLRPGLHYINFKDLDRQGNEFPIRFFLSDKQLVFIGHPRLNNEKVLEWVSRGIINTPMDLVRTIGSKILHQHQIRLESIEDQMDHLEEEILNNPVSRQQGKIIAIHRKVIHIKKSLNYHITAFDRLASIDSATPSLWSELIAETERELENIRQTHDLVESLREAYQASIDNRANDIMKLLTLLATVLLPINLLTSFFGMNFETMPLIRNPYGIEIFYSACLLILVTVILYFWKKDWLR
ncbi:CorA family divalent cation transporter [Desulfitobacterium sp. Sab5]|uniref:CorA family divalent cation transporter n=1 Tax=Desulfitobacterium TaxID=36853 RepID=UPI003CEC4B02